jgi:hypothetical protein
MPGIYYLLAPILQGADVAHQFDAGVAVLFRARELMLLFAASAVGSTILLGASYRGASVGWIAGTLLSLSVVFIARTLEIRPDVPALACWAASSWTIVSGLVHEEKRRRGWWTASGLLLGITLVFTQKILLAGPGFAAFSVVYLIASEQSRTLASKLLDLLVFAVASAVPFLVVALHYLSKGTLATLVDGVLMNNVHWIREVSPRSTLMWMMLRDPFLCALIIPGTISAAVRLLRDAGHRAAHAAVFFPAASLFAGMAFIPAPYPQYLLLVVPVASVYAADELVRWFSRGLTAQSFRVDKVGTFGSIFEVTAFVAVLFAGMGIARPFFRHPAVYPMIGVAVAAAVLVFVHQHKPTYACLVVLAGISTFTAQQLVWMHGLSNSDAIAEMRYIYQATSERDTVMDGFSGVGWFRPQASFYWFTAPGVRARMSTSEKATLVDLLERCEARPKVVILDQHLRDLSPKMEAAVWSSYHPTAYPTIWIRDEKGQSCRTRQPEVSSLDVKSHTN